ncbi:hypothetical protein GUITHDRAFT_113846 [Guillardia theta CCMP2712]|uniref:RWP-RK domain-containing protein n=1 Tax=Guillardia theta (strain CCMP2712) TaxID=905079 RepID=L1IV37_GUITC|nr:hypothetical protein GUITHDRAFT_113846 [Guillardia theta CCMP2712]EKX40108.1 hypothetical protein GUITHDRAFT_113846 [Guillardia theta CCMP2712]|eukprot:XP_005827088.1 hypothetical protein GUITHDRAFT_113846 [Guillardia theta CCMP2712]
MFPTVQVFPRRKNGETHRNGVVNLSYSDILNLFHLRQDQAAKELGISITALRGACKRLGVPKWPYPRHRDDSDQASDRPDRPHRPQAGEEGSASSTRRVYSADTPTLVDRRSHAGLSDSRSEASAGSAPDIPSDSAASGSEQEEASRSHSRADGDFGLGQGGRTEGVEMLSEPPPSDANVASSEPGEGGRLDPAFIRWFLIQKDECGEDEL